MSAPRRLASQLALTAASGVAILALGSAGCEEKLPAERRLSSFEVRLESPVGAPNLRCPLPGTPTSAFDLTGCPVYDVDASGRTVAKVQISARAIDNFGEFYPDFTGVAAVKVVPGKIVGGFDSIRFQDGVAAPETIAFRASFGDTRIWVVDELAPPRSGDVPGLGRACNLGTPACADFELRCVNTKPTVGFDPLGLAYCSRGCAADADCPSGYFCGTELTAYDDGVADVSSGACMRKQPSRALGTAGPVHLVIPTLADISRSDTLISSPFEDEFIEVRRGHMVVTAVRVDGFYVTDICPLPPEAGGPAPDDPDCTPEDRAIPAEFNHLFVFNFSRPEELFPGDKITSVAGPMTEFVGLTELTFPLWEVDTARSPSAIPPPIDLSDPIQKWFPALLERSGRCFDPRYPPERITLLDCPYALERLEGARVKLTIKSTIAIVPGSTEDDTLERFGQWPALVDNGVGGGELRVAVITRENLPFYDPRANSGRTIGRPLVGNVRQVAFDDRQEPLWIFEPRDQADCPWCTN